MENSIVLTRMFVYWSLGLVGVCGTVLVIIALLSLLLIKGEEDFPNTWKKAHIISAEKKNDGHSCNLLTEAPMEVQFFRIGRESVVQKELFFPEQWYSIGSGKEADFCLDADDHKLAKRHFRIYIDKSFFLVAAMEKETFVNGVPIKKLDTIKARNGDLIRAGSHEYRVIILSCEEKENGT